MLFERIIGLRIASGRCRYQGSGDKRPINLFVNQSNSRFTVVENLVVVTRVSVEIEDCVVSDFVISDGDITGVVVRMTSSVYFFQS